MEYMYLLIARTHSRRRLGLQATRALSSEHPKLDEFPMFVVCWRLSPIHIHFASKSYGDFEQMDLLLALNLMRRLFWSSPSSHSMQLTDVLLRLP